MRTVTLYDHYSQFMHLAFGKIRYPVRSSDALKERESYRTVLTDYKPILLPGDPVIEWNTQAMSPKRARRVCEAFLSIWDERVQVFCAFIEDQGIHFCGSKSSQWDALQAFIARHCELSQEKVDRNQKRVRPIARSLLWDVAILAGEHIATSHNAKPCFANDLSQPGAGNLPYFPRVLIKGQAINPLQFCNKFYFPVWSQHEDHTAPSSKLGDAVLSISDPHFDNVSSSHEESPHRTIWLWYETFKHQYNREPNAEELAEFVVECQFSEENIPNKLLQSVQPALSPRVRKHH